MSITEERLTEIRARLAAATEGPWTVDDDDPEYIVFPEKGGYDGWVIAKVVDQDEALFPVEHNGQFIAHAPTDIADLLAEIDRLRGKLADAWDEGYKVGAADWDSIYWHAVGTGVTNPYRKDQS